MMPSMFHQKLIAEVGSVHDGSFGNALKLIDVAAASGANIVKFQTHVADAETLPDAPMPSYFKGEPRQAYFRRTAFSPDQWQKLSGRCSELGVGFLSSVFAFEAVDMLEEIGVGAYKIPSGEVTNIPLLERVALTGKPVLISSGMSNWAELERGIEALKGASEIVPMQCTTAYPCPPELIGLNVIAEMRQRFGLPVGYSDHTSGSAASIAAVALGAVCVEKHLTFSKLMYGSDAANAMEPDVFKSLADGLHEVWQALEHPVDKDDVERFADMKLVFEKSVVTARAIPAGTRIAAIDLAYKKPGDGIPPGRYREIVGRTASRDLPPNHKLSPEDLK
jgi:N-acetylneuraminate synthase